MTTYNKVTINNQTLIDLSSDTVTPNTLLNGVTAHDNSGAIITGTYVPSGGATINNQNKTVRPSEEEQSITADNGYTGLGTVTIEAIDDEYIGSAIDRRDETDLTSTNNVVTVPAGYYAEEETKTIAIISHAAPTISVNTSTGVITATHIQGGGYVSEDTQTATENLSIQAAATITPNNTSQTAVAANKYTTGAVTVAAVPTETKTIITNGTYTPTTGKYFSSVTVNVPSVNISQDANGYIVLDDESWSGYSGGGGYTVDDIATGEPSGAITITVPTIVSNAFIYNAKITSVTTNGTTQINGGAFQYCTELVTADLTGVTTLSGSQNMSYCSKLTTLLIPDLVTISNQAFRNCKLTGTLKLQNLTSGSGNSSFYGNTLLTKVYFFKKINISWQENLFNGCTGITDIYVPWSSGEVSGAPWGASNATVHYDTVYDENDEPIV